MNTTGLSSILAILSVVMIGYFVYLKGKNRLENQFFVLLTIAMAVWNLGIHGTIMAGTEKEAIIWTRILFTGVIFVPILFLQFVYALLSETIRKQPLFLLWILTFSFLIISPFKFFAKGVLQFNNIYFADANIGLALFIVWFLIFSTYGIYKLFMGYKNAVDLRRFQLFYIFLASVIYFFGEELVIPTLFNFPVFGAYLWWNYTTVIFAVLVAYAILRHRLMDITVIIRKSLVFSSVIALFTGVYLCFIYFFSNYFDVFVRNFSFNFHLDIRMYRLINIFNAILSFLIATFVLFYGKRTKSILLFSVFAYFVAFWAFFLFLSHIVNNYQLASFLFRTCMIFAVLILPVFTEFVYHFTGGKIDWKYRSLNFGIAFLIISVIYTDLYAIDSGPFLIFKYWPIANYMSILEMVIFVINFFFAQGQLYKTSFLQQSSISNQTKLIFFSTFLGFIGGASNFLLWFRIPFPPIIKFVIPLNFLILIYVFAVAYAILKHQLMDIVVVIKKTLIYSLMITVFTALYLVLVFALGQAFQGYIGISSAIMSISLLIIFSFLFQPLKMRIQDCIEKRFFAEKYLLKSYLGELSSKVISIIDLEKLLDLTVQSLQGIFKAQYVEILLLDKKTKYFRAKASRPRDIITSMSDNFSIVQKMKKQKAILLMNELIEDKAAYNELKKLEASIVIPLVSKDNLIGFILCGENKGEIGHDESSLLSNLSSQLSIAIENAYLIKEKLEAERHLMQADKLKSLGTIAASMAHEIKNPLTVITGLTRSAEEKFLEGDKDFFHDFNDIVPRQLERIKKIAEGLSQYGKKNPSEKRMVNLNKILEEALQLFEAKCRDNNIEIQKNLSDIPLIQADPEQMTQVFTNLILNAIEAMEACLPTCPPEQMRRGKLPGRRQEAMEGQGVLQVESRVVDVNKIEVIIADTGCGISEDKIKDIFEPFYTTKEQGSGLGLAVTKKIIEEHGGSIIVESEVNKRTRFVIRF